MMSHPLTSTQSPRHTASGALTSSSGLTLPSELLTEILQWLDWTDILRVRQTCKFMLAATQSRIIWRGLVNEHMSTSLIPPALERPVNMYTATELQNLLLLWKSAEYGWKTDGTHVARERMLKTCRASFENIYLTPGGRWLLVLGNYGALTCYDLDSDNFDKTQLIPDQLENRSKSPVNKERLMLVEHNTSSSTFSFTVVVSIKGHFIGSDAPNGEHKLQIWRVFIAPDELQNVTRLEARLLASFHHRAEVHKVWSLSLLGPVVAFVGSTQQYRSTYVYVLEWERWKAQGSTHYPLIISNRKVWPRDIVHLLSSSRILIIGQRHFSLYDYSTARETYGSSPLPNEQSEFSLLQRLNEPHFFLSFSRPSESTSRLLRLRRSSLAVVTFEDKTMSPASLEFIKIGDLATSNINKETGPRIGQSVTLASRDDRLCFYTYPVTSNGDTPNLIGPFWQTWSANDLPSFETKLFDEQSGRILLINDPTDGLDVKVIDIALVYRNT